MKQNSVPCHITTKSDLKNFNDFLSSKNIEENGNTCLLRWASWFDHFTFETEHVPGIQNQIADFLSKEYEFLTPPLQASPSLGFLQFLCGKEKDNASYLISKVVGLGKVENDDKIEESTTEMDVTTFNDIIKDIIEDVESITT